MNVQRELRRGATLLENRVHAHDVRRLPGLLRQIANLLERFDITALGPVQDALEREAARWRACPSCSAAGPEASTACSTCDGERVLPAEEYHLQGGVPLMTPTHVRDQVATLVREAIGKLERTWSEAGISAHHAVGSALGNLRDARTLLEAPPERTHHADCGPDCPGPGKYHGLEPGRHSKGYTEGGA